MAGTRHSFAHPALCAVLAASFASPPLATPVSAATLAVEPGGLAAALASARPGDTLVLKPGVHPGPVVLDQPVTLTGEAGAVVDGGGHGRTITIAAADVAVRGLTVRNSGLDLTAMEAGIFVGKAGNRALVEDNALLDNLTGVYLWGAHDALVRRNRIVGRRDLPVTQRGSAVNVWNAPGSKVIGNDISYGKDGIFTQTSERNDFSGNHFENVRFAVHYMYTNKSTVAGNVSVGNDVGYAIMYSDRLVIRDNVSDGDRDHGLMLNSTNNSEVTGNVVTGTGTAGEKCLFIYNANKNAIRDNWFEGCGIGIHFTAGSERNRLSGNAFIGNRTQVMYVGTRALDWSENGRGNYWSDNPGFDLDGDGLADQAYRPNDLVDTVVWTYPAAKLLLNSPGIQVIRWAQAQFPALHPGGVIDTAPLMRPIRPAVLPEEPTHVR